MELKRALNLGAGKRPRARGHIPEFGYEIVCHDKRLYPNIDVAWDLDQCPWPWEDEEFDRIVAFDVIEHLWDTVAFMDECWRIVKPAGVLIIHTNNVEYPEQAWRDPTHKRVYCYDSFDFFDPETRWGAEYLLSDKAWEVKDRRRDGQELLFCLKRR